VKRAAGRVGIICPNEKALARSFSRPRSEAERDLWATPANNGAADRGLATATFAALKLQRPLFL